MSKFIITMHVELQDERSNDEVMSLVAQMEELLHAEDLGRFVGSGGGLNQIDLTYMVEDQARAKESMEKALGTLGLRETHSFTIEEFTGDEAAYFDDEEGVSLGKLTYFFGLILFLFVSLVYIVWTVVVEIRK
jgi:hypothetical protein